MMINDYTCNPPFVPLFVLVSNVILPTLEPLIFPTTVPLSPGPTSWIIFDVIVLSVFLKYPLPALGAAPPVLFVGVLSSSFLQVVKSSGKQSNMSSSFFIILVFDLNCLLIYCFIL